jgi:isopentenyl-diphosphate delta-isomerase
MSAGDELVLVDVLDRPTGTASKEETHRLGLLHRAFSVFLVRGDEVLLQRRAPGKYHSGGLWTNSCCSHPRVGEDLASAVGRRLFDELGVVGCDCREVGSFVYRHQFADDLFEYEYDHVFLGEWHGGVIPDPDEAMDVRWVPIPEAMRLLQEEPAIFTCWFPSAASCAFAAAYEAHDISRV